MNRRRFLALVGVAVPGLWLDGSGLIQLPRNMVIALSGSCSFCGKHAQEVFGLAGVVTRPTRICNECIDICLAIFRDDEMHPPAPPQRSVNQVVAQDYTHQAEIPLTRDELEALLEALRECVEQEAKPHQWIQKRQRTCSFCDHVQEETKKMIAGPTVYICDACVGDAASLLCLHS